MTDEQLLFELKKYITHVSPWLEMTIFDSVCYQITMNKQSIFTKHDYYNYLKECKKLIKDLENTYLNWKIKSQTIT